MTKDLQRDFKSSYFFFSFFFFLFFHRLSVFFLFVLFYFILLLNFFFMRSCFFLFFFFFGGRQTREKGSHVVSDIYIYTHMYDIYRHTHTHNIYIHIFVPSSLRFLNQCFAKKDCTTPQQGKRLFFFFISCFPCSFWSSFLFCLFFFDYCNYFFFVFPLY